LSKVKTFNDLVFKRHRISEGYPNDIEDLLGFRNAIHATMMFDNGNTISVVGGGPLYGDGVDTFEVMDHEGEVHGYLTKSEVTKLMSEAQNSMIKYDIKTNNFNKL
jgi:hypothetical protein